MYQRYLLVLLLWLIVNPLLAQDNEDWYTQEELKESNNGGYVALTTNYSAIDNNNAIVIGTRGGWTLNHKTTFGAGAYAFFNSSEPNPKINSIQLFSYSIQGGYGGIYIERSFKISEKFFINTPVFFGIGNVSYICDTYYDYPVNETWSDFIEDSDKFSLIEPGIEFEFSIFKHARLICGFYYRFASDIELIGEDMLYEPENSETTERYFAVVSPNLLDGVSFGLTFKFGKF